MSEPGSPAFLDDDCYRQHWLCLSWMLPSDGYGHCVINTHLPCLETLRLYLLSLYKVITFSYTFYLPKTFWDVSPTFDHSLILYKYIFFFYSNFSKQGRLVFVVNPSLSTRNPSWNLYGMVWYDTILYGMAPRTDSLFPFLGFTKYKSAVLLLNGYSSKVDTPLVYSSSTYPKHCYHYFFSDNIQEDYKDYKEIWWI